MNNKKFLWITGSVLLIAGLIVGTLAIFGLLPGQGGELYEDPQGRFTMQVDPSWEQVETDGAYTQFVVPEPPMSLYMLVLDASTVEDGFVRAVEILGFEPGLLEGGGTTIIGDWQAYVKDDSAGLATGLAGQIAGGKAYIMVAKTSQPGITIENAATMGALESIKIAGKEEVVIESYTELEAMVQELVDRRAGSISAAVLHKDEIVYTYAYGEANPVEGIPADSRSIYRFGSMTKLFTATALMQLVEKGLVDLEAWPGEYIPEFPQNWKVTVRQLLNHSACMPDYSPMVVGLIAMPGETFPTYEEVFAAYLETKPVPMCEPGKVSNYANAHFLALARIIEEVSGESYETYVTDHILAPLDMDSTHFQMVEPDERYAKGQYPTAQVDGLLAQLTEFRGPEQEGFVLHRGESFSSLGNFRILPPWGGLSGTPEDVTHFLQMQMNGGRYGENQILQPESVALMHEMQKSTGGSPLGFGLSWWTGKDEYGDFLFHGGGGATIETTMRFYPDLDLGIVVMSSFNGSQAASVADGLASAWMHEK